MRRYPRSGPKYPAPTAPHYLVAVDLGKTKLGVAVFHSVEGLKWAATVQAPRGSTAGAVATWVMGHVLDNIPDWGEAACSPRWVCEWPQKYGTARRYYKNLDELYAVGVALGQLNNGWDEKYAPREWKGNVPKTAHQHRIERRLTIDEVDTMTDYGHDAWDAVGIGLFALGRTQSGGVS